jgi:hypothetical protein
MLTDSTLFDLATVRLRELRHEAETARLAGQAPAPGRGIRSVLADALLGLASWIDDRPAGLNAGRLGTAH